MTRFIFCFICYIGIVFLNFNTAVAEYTEAEKPLILIETKKSTQDEQAEAAFPQPTPEKKKHKDRFQKLSEEIYKIFLTPFIINKLYPEEKLKQDITGTLATLYPTASKETLYTMSSYIKSFISIKRRYDYTIKRLEHQIKALKLLPEDELIIANDGEFAPEFSDERKQSATDEYTIKYTPYKYIGYDTGELGEPVRRRDKNYQEKIKNIDEVVLAILKFDIAGFFKAVNKLPKSTDNSAEKPVKLANGVEARLLMANSAPGEDKKQRAVIEVYIPEGHYITADYLNPNTRPQFFLSEDKNTNLNINSYELFLPEANCVIKDKKAKRILTRTVRYPLEFTRRDINKPATLKGKFVFELCDKAGNCAPTITSHEFTIKPSLDEELSIYYNYVTQGFTHLPPAKSKHAELKSAKYDEANKKLSLKFKTTRAFSQVAVMAEDASGTNFINPRYEISENEVTATFDVQNNTSSSAPNTPIEMIAVTAMFDNAENLRATTQPVSETAWADLAKRGAKSAPATPHAALPAAINYSSPSFKHTIAQNITYGFFLSLMPGVFYLVICLIRLLWNRKKRAVILLAYAIGAATGLALLAYTFSGRYWSEIYETPWLTALSLIVVTSYLSECVGYMDFAWFRPFKNILRQGFLIGFFAVLLLSSFPMLMSADMLSQIFALPTEIAFSRYLSIWFGLMILPLIAYFFPQNKPLFFKAMQRLNIIYNLIYISGALFLIGVTRSERAIWLTILVLGLVWSLWYLFPQAVTETIKHTTSKTKQQRLFNKVQQHALIVLTILFLLALAAIKSAPVIKEAPTALTPIDIIKEQKTHSHPTLVAITAPWSVMSALNSAYLQKLKKDNIQTIEIKAIGKAKNVAPWFATYHSRHAPLNVLFTKRHPYGLVLPNNLSEINWKVATDTFGNNSPSKEESPQNERTTSDD